MDSNKKSIIIRLVIFYILALLPLIIITIVQANAYGTDLWVSENEDAVFATSVSGMFGMLAPSVAVLITRLITKEGFKDSYLGWTAKKGNIKYFVFSLILKPIESFFGVLVFWKAFFGEMTLSEFISDEDPALIAAMLLLQYAMSVIVFFPAFGEEWGWRGYMMPKLLKIMPKPAAIIVGGVLWGLWHSPLTVTGHNFGVGYAGYPWLGILLMCGYCIFMNAVLTFLTERTKSIYPAAFCHMINNNLSVGVAASLIMSKKAAEHIEKIKLDPLSTSCIVMGIACIAGSVCFILFVRGEKKKTSETEITEKAA